MKNYQNLQSKNHGYVLISVLVIMAVLIAITYFFADALFSELAIARNQKSSSVCFHLAEGGAQEAIWRIKNDSATRNTFLNTTNGITTFSHNSGLLNGGSYNVTIQNTAEGAATITATGLYQIGLKSAQRKITLNVFQSSNISAYEYDAGLMVCGANSGDINLHNMNVLLDDEPDPNNMISCGDINIGNANVTVDQNIIANGDIAIHNSDVDTVGTEQENSPNTYSMPGIDISSAAPDSYKSLAIAQNQYYTSAQFTDLIKTQTTFNGIVYVAGSSGVTIKNKTLTFNGTLVSEGSISVTNATVNVNHTTGPSGILTLQNLSFVNAIINVEGLIYVGVEASTATNAIINVEGAILANSFNGNNATLTIAFRKDWASETITGGGNNATPVIEMQHWEEEY